MTPAGVRQIFWSHTYAELKAQVSLRLGFEAAKMTAFTQSLSLVAQQLFGGGPSTSDGETPGVAKPKNTAELNLALAQVLGGV